MTALTLKNISKGFGADTILRDVSFALQDDMRLGLVGPNGVGKTTLLRIICGEIACDGGTAAVGSGVSVGYLPQETGAGTEISVWETMLGVFEGAFALEERMRTLEKSMEEAADDPAQWRKISGAYEEATKAFEDAGGYGYQSAIKGVLTGLKLTEDVYDKPVSLLSGGQRARLNLARLLLLKPSLLLLDEPTNHLDMDAALWLEAYLKSWPGTMVIVSHDRWFLDQLCTHVGHLTDGVIDVYTGNYTSFVSQRQQKLMLMEKAYEHHQKEIGRQKQVIERYYAWGRSGGGKNFIKAKARERQLEQMERAEKAPASHRKMSLRLDASARSGNEVLGIRDAEMIFGKRTLFSGLDIDLRKGDKAALIGANGVGKTTLLRIAAGTLIPTQGDVFCGSGVTVSYYDQLQETLDQKKTVLEEMRDAYPKLTDGELRNALASFLFYGDDAFKKITALSGGEKGRLSLLKLMMAGGNLLLLDEPTNHLDMDSREVLEEALTQFEGTVLFVSHDRYFINKVANRVLDMRNGQVFQHDGNWADYIAFLEKERRQPTEEADTGMTKTAAAKLKRVQSQREEQIREEKRHIARIEQDIALLEERLSGVEAWLADPSGLGEEELLSLSNQHAQISRQIDAAMKEWEQAQNMA